MEEKILEIINRIRAKKDLLPIMNLTPELSLGIDLDFDSLDLAQLTVLIEDEFDVDIFAEDIIETVGEIFECIKKEKK